MAGYVAIAARAQRSLALRRRMRVASCRCTLTGEGVVVIPGQAAAFMSYARFDDQHEGGRITEFRENLSAEVRFQTAEEFVIFQDRNDIAWGQSWQRRIEEGLDAATLLLVVITPSFFRSEACRKEVKRFLRREYALGRHDLILPLYYATTPEIEDPQRRKADALAQSIASRQYADWRELRFDPFTSPEMRRAVAQLATRMRDTFWHQQSNEPARLAAAARGDQGTDPLNRILGLGSHSSKARDLDASLPAGEPPRQQSVTSLFNRLYAGPRDPEFAAVRQILLSRRHPYPPEDRIAARELMPERGWYVSALTEDNPWQVEEILSVIFQLTVIPDLEIPVITDEVARWVSDYAAPVVVVRAMIAAAFDWGDEASRLMDRALQPAIGQRWLAEHGIYIPDEHDGE
jgi:TIR domain